MVYSVFNNIGSFQFVGIILEKSILENSSILLELSYFFLTIGFLMSILGGLTVFISSLFIRTLRHEKNYLLWQQSKNIHIFLFWLYYVIYKFSEHFYCQLIY